jgi:hypothetical protein
MRAKRVCHVLRCNCGNNIWLSYDNNHSAGVAVLRGAFKGKVVSIKTHHSAGVAVLRGTKGAFVRSRRRWLEEGGEKIQNTFTI